MFSKRLLSSLSMGLLLNSFLSVQAAEQKSSTTGSSILSTDATIPAANWTPLIMTTIHAPSLLEGSDGKQNLVYNMLLSNVSSHPVKIEKIEFLDAKSKKVLHTLSGEDLLKVFTTLPTPKTAEIRECGIAIVWVNLSFDNVKSAPAEVLHRITFSGFSADNKPEEYSYDAQTTKVESVKQVVIGPPMLQGKWLICGGYSGNFGHRRALFGLSNELLAAQTYAIDYVQLNDKNEVLTGPADVLTNAVCYGKPIVSVADGTVCGVIDKFPDQTTNPPVGEDRVAYPGGNSVIVDIGSGLYAFFAHMKPGSVKVKVGDKVTKGQVLGLVGNSGNSTGPHLHMHIVNAPSPLNANAVPYAFEKFEVLGELKDLEKKMADLDSKPGPVEIEPTVFDGVHHNQLPKEGLLVRFN